MGGEVKKISPWRVAVIFGAMIVFLIGIPSLPGKHHLIYWGIAFVFEALICVTLLPFTGKNSNRSTTKEKEETMSNSKCIHVKDHVKSVKPSSKGCEDCMKSGDSWVHLRMCLECGYVGCCDSSKNRHARAHFEATKHPIIQSAERGEKWRWCYVDGIYLD